LLIDVYDAYDKPAVSAVHSVNCISLCHSISIFPFPPAGDQPAAIQNLTEGILNGEKYQTLLGVTGSGKTYTIANVIQQLQRPTLVLTHNKTLVAQLYGEFRQFFPENAVEYFVSYYDYYQPEALYISKKT